MADDLRTLGDLGYEGESDTITLAFKKPKDGHLTGTPQIFNKNARLLTAFAGSPHSPAPGVHSTSPRT